MFKKDAFWFGLLVGLVLPLLLAGILFLIDMMSGILAKPPLDMTVKKLLFVCIALNILPIRYYFIKEHMENTAKGLLFITVVMILTVTFAL